MKLKRCKKSEIIDYIKIYWDNDENRKYIPKYSKRNGKKIGVGLGCYTDDDKLIGFCFYTCNRFINIIRQKLRLAFQKECKEGLIWEINLLEVHPDYRQQGIGSMLVQEVYRRMPKGNLFIAISERTNNHFRFYTKNGLEHFKDDDPSNGYSFIKYKMT